MDVTKNKNISFYFKTKHVFFKLNENITFLLLIKLLVF